MVNYSYGQLQTIWLDAAKGTQYATSAWAHLMAAIALAESAGNPQATNPNDNGGTQTSWGLWQISLGNHNAPAPDWSNPYTNAKLAIGKLQGQGLGAWGTYTSGAYKQFMQGSGPSNVPAPTGSGAGSGGGSGGGGGGSGPTAMSWTMGIPIPGLEWLGSLISGVSGPARTIGDIGTAVTGLVRASSKFLQLFALLFRPSFWLRVLAGIAGAILLIGAVYMMSEAV